MAAHVPPTIQPARRRDGLVAGACAAVAAATVLIATLVPDAHREARPMAALERDATCLEWSDACVVCTRTPEGQACSMPGIACEPSPPRCLRRTGS